MATTLPIAKSGYTLHVLTTAPRTHVAQLVRPDGSIVTTWTRICGRWGLKRNITELRDSIEDSLGTKAIVPVYYASRVVVAEKVPAAGLLQRS